MAQAWQSAGHWSQFLKITNSRTALLQSLRYCGRIWVEQNGLRKADEVRLRIFSEGVSYDKSHKSRQLSRRPAWRIRHFSLRNDAISPQFAWQIVGGGGGFEPTGRGSQI